MAKEQKREISVVTVFDGKQDGQQVFIDLILKKRRAGADSRQFGIDAAPPDRYTQGKVFSDVRVG
jgi:hypothetical protein